MTKILWQLRLTEAHQRRTGLPADWQGGLPERVVNHVVNFLLDWAR